MTNHAANTNLIRGLVAAGLIVAGPPTIFALALWLQPDGFNLVVLLGSLVPGLAGISMLPFRVRTKLLISVPYIAVMAFVAAIFSIFFACFALSQCVS
jgi:hypothetical protein